MGFWFSFKRCLVTGDGVEEIFKEFLKTSVDVVVVDNTDQIILVMNIVEQLRRFRVFLIDRCPFVHPDSEGFVLPVFESFLADNGGLNNFPVGENTPCDGGDSLFVVQGCQFLIVSGNGDNGDLLGFSCKLNQLLGQRRLHEDFDVLFLVDISILGSPSKLGIVGVNTVDSGLTVDSENFAFIERNEELVDQGGFFSQMTFHPRQTFYRAIEKTYENLGNVAKSLRFTPHLQSVFFLVVMVILIHGRIVC
mmetsp:Transcript_10754/g.11727  ORF Transcript_10754/g.11727 Transcript_10754/m.11727 type:complete len:250 (+) Transcript_10754:292-1041(+)